MDRTKNLAGAYALHEKALKTASSLKYVVVPLSGDTPIPATFIQANSDEIAHGHEPCVFTLPTACELVRNLKASRGLNCSYITEVEFHELALKSLAGKPGQHTTMAQYEMTQLENGHPAGRTRTFDSIEQAVINLREWATYFIADGYEDMVASISVCSSTAPFEQKVEYTVRKETCDRVESLITYDTTKVILWRTDGKWRSAEIRLIQ